MSPSDAVGDLLGIEPDSFEDFARACSASLWDGEDELDSVRQDRHSFNVLPDVDGFRGFPRSVISRDGE